MDPVIHPAKPMINTCAAHSDTLSKRLSFLRSDPLLFLSGLRLWSETSSALVYSPCGVRRWRVANSITIYTHQSCSVTHQSAEGRKSVRHDKEGWNKHALQLNTLVYGGVTREDPDQSRVPQKRQLWDSSLMDLLLGPAKGWRPTQRKADAKDDTSRELESQSCLKANDMCLKQETMVCLRGLMEKTLLGNLFGWVWVQSTWDRLKSENIKISIRKSGPSWRFNITENTPNV